MTSEIRMKKTVEIFVLMENSHWCQRWSHFHIYYWMSEMKMRTSNVIL